MSLFRLASVIIHPYRSSAVV